MVCLRRVEEAKALYCKVIPVARRVLGEGHEITLKLRWGYAQMLFTDPAATHDDLRESVTTLEETLPTLRRVLGGAHPMTVEVERNLGDVRAALRTTLEEALSTARRLLGGAHPVTVEIERDLGDVRAALRDARCA